MMMMMMARGKLQNFIEVVNAAAELYAALIASQPASHSADLIIVRILIGILYYKETNVAKIIFIPSNALHCPNSNWNLRDQVI